jgi:hypothetical protein
VYSQKTSYKLLIYSKATFKTSSWVFRKHHLIKPKLILVYFEVLIQKTYYDHAEPVFKNLSSVLKKHLKTFSQWNNTFFQCSLITEGTTENVFKYISHLSQLTTKTLVLLNQNAFLNTTDRFKQENIF